MQCQICNKNLGEYQCSNCGRIVCRFDERIINNKVVCVNCIKAAPSRPKTASDSLKTVIITVAIIFIAMLFILYFTNNYVNQIQFVPGIETFIALFKTMGLYMVGGVGFILFILIIAYLVFRRKTPQSI